MKLIISIICISLSLQTLKSQDIPQSVPQINTGMCECHLRWHILSFIANVSIFEWFALQLIASLVLFFHSELT